MNVYDAANFLGLTGEITPEAVKAAYRIAAKKYHPDVNPAGLEMMKFINGAFDVLKDYEGEVNHREGVTVGDYPDALNAAIEAVMGLDGLVLEICGAWLWVSGETYPHRPNLKDAGFRFAGKKKMWFFRPEDYRSRNRQEHSMDEIREKYGTSRPEHRQRHSLPNQAGAS